ncbi:MAG: 30S ribosomal protein S2 [Methyloceanibacter sp.]|nr:30S ribosomal protein S2 [Methyloceanibacter sp.]
MALPNVTMRQLLEAGVHFGHQTHRWNPKMAPFIYGSRNNIHIIDLTQTVPLLHQALLAVSDVVAKGGRVLFVGTKRQASEAVADAAKSCAQYYVNHRWLGGTLTNWRTISNSIKRLKTIEELLTGDHHGLTKKELLQLTREKDKLERSLGGIKDMGAVPDLMFVIDTNKESIAVAEARKLHMPVVAVVDSNCDPEGISHPIPGNDDAGRAITLYCDLIARAAIDGIERAQGAGGVDLGAEEGITEPELEGEEGAERAAPGADRRPKKRTGRGGGGNGKARFDSRRPARKPNPAPEGQNSEAKPEGQEPEVAAETQQSEAKDD